MKLIRYSMRKGAITIFLLLTGVVISFGQRNLGRGINSKIDGEFYPSVTADGRLMLYLRKYRMGNKWMLFRTKQVRPNEWVQGLEVENYSQLIELNYPGSHFMTYFDDGIYYSTKKAPGVGSYDIVYMSRNGSNFSKFENFGKPLNSDQAELFPSVTPDGSTMYLLRGKGVEDELYYGDIMVSSMVGGRWSEPKPIGNGINTGKETKPLILADGKTLIFASKRAGGKGGYDLYMTVNEDGQWSNPVNLEYLNDEKDNINVSIPASNYAAYYQEVGPEETFDLYMKKIPDEFRPYDNMYIYGSVKNADESACSASVFVFDIESNAPVYNTQTDDNGIFKLILTEGQKYDLTIIPRDYTLQFYSEIIDLSTLDEFERKKLDLKLESNSNLFSLNNVNFDGNSTMINAESKGEILRLIKFMQNNRDKKVKFMLELQGYQEDSTRTDMLDQEKSDTIQTDSVIVTTTVYHNNKLDMQSQALTEYLEQLKVPAGMYSIESKYTEIENSEATEPKVKVSVMFE